MKTLSYPREWGAIVLQDLGGFAGGRHAQRSQIGDYIMAYAIEQSGYEHVVGARVAHPKTHTSPQHHVQVSSRYWEHFTMCFGVRYSAEDCIRLSSNYDERLQALEDTLRSLVQQLQGSPVSSCQASGGLQDTSYDNVGSLDSLNSQQVTVTEDVERPSLNNMEGSADEIVAIAFPEDTGSRYFGPSSNIAFFRHISRATTAVITNIAQNPGAMQQFRPDFVSLATPPSTCPDPGTSRSRARDAKQTLPSDKRFLTLFHAFFYGPGLLLGYLDKNNILENYHKEKRNGFARVSRTWLWLVNIILAFSAYTGCSSPDHHVEANEAEAESFFQRAQSLCSESDPEFANVQTVQCLLLTSQYCQGTQRPELAWHLHKMAVSHSLRLGLHAQERDVYERTWFGCVVLDRVYSVNFGRPPSIPNHYVRLSSPSAISLEELDHCSMDNISQTVSFSRSQIDMAHIDGQIVSELYGDNLNANPPLCVSTTLAQIVNLEGRLEKWRETLPPYLRMSEWLKDGTVGSVTTILESSLDRLSIITLVRYHHARILLHRPILTLLLERTTQRKSCTSSGSEDDSFFNHVNAESVRLCHESATKLIHIIDKRSESMALLGSWWFAAYHCFYAALVLFGCHVVWAVRAFKSINCQQENVDTAIATQLGIASETIHRLGRNAKHASDICKTLERLKHLWSTISRFRTGPGPDGCATNIPWPDSEGVLQHGVPPHWSPLTNVTGEVSKPRASTAMNDILHINYETSTTNHDHLVLWPGNLGFLPTLGNELGFDSLPID
ncbi:fungal-specific transcription factor domain-containing protein [Aspergillus californicus]